MGTIKVLNLKDHCWIILELKKINYLSQGLTVSRLHRILFKTRRSILGSDCIDSYFECSLIAL